MFEEIGVALSDVENTLVASLLVRRQLIVDELQKEQAKVEAALKKVMDDVQIKAGLEGRQQLIQQEAGKFRLVVAPEQEELGVAPKDV